MAVALIWASAGVLVAEWIETHILWRLVRKDAKRRVDQYAARESFLYG